MFIFLIMGTLVQVVINDYMDKDIAKAFIFDKNLGFARLIPKYVPVIAITSIPEF